MQKQILQIDGAEGSRGCRCDTGYVDQSWRKNDVISVPVLGIYADRSGLVNGDGMKRLYWNLEYHEIPGAAHFLMMERPQEFNRLLMDFLAKVKF